MRVPLRAGIRPVSRVLAVVPILALIVLHEPRVLVQGDGSAAARHVYDQIKTFSLDGGSADVTDLALERDRGTMTFKGTFYFAAPVDGRVTGAVFVGDGTFRAEAPPSDFEKDNLRRLIGAEVVESDFHTAVLRFTDDTFARIGAARRDGGAPPAPAGKLASEFEPRLLRETGINLSARLAGSILNSEAPGVFFAQFDGGKRGRFNYVLDQQDRIPVQNFTINGGEKGLIFSHEPAIYGNDVWMAFYALQDYGKIVPYSDTNDLVDITNYQMNVDLRDAGSRLALVAHMDMQVRGANTRAIPFMVGEALSEHDSDRLKKQLRVKGVRIGSVEVASAQEDWEGGFTVFLPKALQAGERLTIDVALEGDFMHTVPVIPECFYPIVNTAWYPRHGYLDRATYDLTFLHQKRHKVASVGLRVSEEPAPDNKDLVVTNYRMDQPISLAVFALGPFDRKRQTITWDKGGDTIPLEFNSVQKTVLGVRDDFILQELDNALRYFTAMFGKYPYPSFGAAFHFYNFGQGFPSLLMIPPVDTGTQENYVFLSHETAHQWWGNIVAWRSYRDQWLSEGFAEYSGMLYAGLRDKSQPLQFLLRRRREALLASPRTTMGIGKGRLNDIGPIILGHRLNTSKSFGAYQALIYDKGALVLRMLHFLLSNPTTGDDKAFSTMMSDFVERYRNGSASSDDFRKVASEHFARSPVAQKYGLKDLDWFFSQWVYRTGLPSYHLEYQLKDQGDGSVIVSGTVHQDNVPDGWFMPLPLVFTFDAGQLGRTVVRALGPSTSFELKLPSKPRKIELDPASWILSEKTTTKEK